MFGDFSLKFKANAESTTLVESSPQSADLFFLNEFCGAKVHQCGKKLHPQIVEQFKNNVLQHKIAKTFTKSSPK